MPKTFDEDCGKTEEEGSISEMSSGLFTHLCIQQIFICQMLAVALSKYLQQFLTYWCWWHSSFELNFFTGLKTLAKTHSNLSRQNWCFVLTKGKEKQIKRGKSHVSFIKMNILTSFLKKWINKAVILLLIRFYYLIFISPHSFGPEVLLDFMPRIPYIPKFFVLATRHLESNVQPAFRKCTGIANSCIYSFIEHLLCHIM